MALSNSQYNAIMRVYQQQQFQDKHEQDRRVEEVYERIPAIPALDEAIRTAAVASARRLLDGNQEALKELREEIADLREQKALLLKAAGYPEDYMELHYQCKDCQDTGYADGKKCHCFKKAKMRLLYAQSNVDEIVKRENFQTFSYEYFDDSYIEPVIGRTVASYMKQVVEHCQEYVRKFPQEHGNLLFTGSTGVGKTFLTNCIAKELIDRYYSVIYLSSNELFDVFSKTKFEYQAEEEMKDLYQYILECDLLIIDDLGTELNNSFTSSQLFYCINERLLAKRSTIISTNLTLNMMRDVYTDRVTSRIMSSYAVIPLYGGDIRLKKRVTVQKPT